MIPKIIHYCWLSNDPIPEELQRYMESWKKYLHDYEFMKWDFNCFDKSSSIWVSDAFDNKKYAFAADYIRLFALYHYGGIYLDMDVEIVKPYSDKILNLKTMICWEKDGSGLEVAAFGVEKSSQWIKKCLNYYENRPFLKEDGSFETKVLPQVIKDLLIRNNYELINVQSIEEGLTIESESKLPILPNEFFSPKSYLTGKIHITEQTYSVHHFAGSWLTEKDKIMQMIASYLNIGKHGYISTIKSFFKKK